MTQSSTQQKPSIVTIGMFDGVHLGHRHLLNLLLQKARELKLEPVVISFHPHPRQVINPKGDPFGLLSTAQERETILKAYGIENIHIITFTPEIAQLSACTFASEILLKNLNAKALILGYDNSFGNKKNNDFDQLPQWARKHGITIFQDTPLLYGETEISSTQIRKALGMGNITLANEMLGYQYSISGTVISGRHDGTKIGFPTANLQLSDNAKLLPKEGVYAVRVNWNGNHYQAMANLGPQPTFNSLTPTIEVHLLSFSQNLYGEELHIEFQQRIRDIIHFETLQDLKNQLQLDKEKIQNL